MTTITHSYHSGFSLTWLRLALHLPAPAARRAPAMPTSSAGWLDRLAAWSDRQPPRQHRLGSYTALR